MTSKRQKKYSELKHKRVDNSEFSEPTVDRSLMKRRIIFLTVAFLTIGLLLYKYAYTNGTDYIVFKGDSTTLIIDDWIEVRKITSLFSLNYHFYDCCNATGDNLYLIQKPNKYRIISRESDHQYLYSNTSIDLLWNRLTKFDTNAIYNTYSVRISSEVNRDSLLEVMTDDSYRVIEPFESDDEHTLSLKYLRKMYQ